MPILSNYSFKASDFRGETTFLSIQHPAGGWAWINRANFGSKRSTLSWEREDREVNYDLLNLLNNPIVLNVIDSNLGEVQRTSDLRIGWSPRKHLPYSSTGGELDLFLRLSFNFHISTPWYCSDADGHIEYIIACYLDGSGKIGAYVHGWSFDYDGGGPFCNGKISSRLNTAIPVPIGILQEQLNAFLGLLGDRRFDLPYYLPGSAEESGSGTANLGANDSRAIAGI